MTKPLQGKKCFEFRDCIMGMSNSENIAKVRKVRNEIAQNEDLQKWSNSQRTRIKKIYSDANIQRTQIKTIYSGEWRI